MNSGFPLGRIAGVRVRLDWTLLVIFSLVVLSLATGALPHSAPPHPRWLDWLLAVIAALLFYATLLGHELAHAVVARRKGMDVEGITLWLLGGVARLHGEAARPRDELEVTGVGPVVSLGFGVVFIALAAILSGLGTGDVVAAVPLWVGVINLVLAAFNLIPAFPLDGGRILHAVLWSRGGDRMRATHLAARAGRGFGIFLIALGVLEFFALAALGGLWFVFLGWFIVSASRAEETQSRTKTALAGLTVGEVMSPDPVAVPDWITVDAFLHDYVIARRFSCFPLRDLDGKLTGLVSIRRLGVVPRSERETTRIRDVAVPLDRVARSRPDEPLVDVMDRLHESDDGRVLVFEGDNLVGIVSSSDVSRALRLAELSMPRS